jgi:signal transduction histidine kinase
MNTRTRPRGAHSAALAGDNQLMTKPAPPSPRRRIFQAPSWRAGSEAVYLLATFWLALAAVAVIVPTLTNGMLWALSTGTVRRLGATARGLAGRLLDDDIPEPPPLRPAHRARVTTPDAVRLFKLVDKAGGRARVWDSGRGLTVTQLPENRVAALAADGGVTVTKIEPMNAFGTWMAMRTLDPPAWRARGYFALKLPLAVVSLAALAAGWLGGLFLITFPAWWSLGLRVPGITQFGATFAFIAVGSFLLLVSPSLGHGLTEVDRWLARALLGPGQASDRIQVLEQTRARAVDDSAARLRAIERDLHDGTQAQLVAVAMKLGLAVDKLGEPEQLDLARVTRLVRDAHQGALEAIADLRTLARGIHPPVLDNGLADALATLAERSAVPVELVTEIPERPSAAIETIAYFSAAELLTNVARHSGARHAVLEAVHVTGLLRVRVTDDGAGGAHPVAGGGLSGLAERVRTVDGRIEVASPPGGPTTVTVELPSHA